MAKVNAPLFSFKASGKLANALVYFGWKGLNVVRSYVVPANPQTTLQTTHRAYMIAAVAKIHATQGLAANPLDEVDQIAYSTLAATRATPRTWFNEICKLWLDTKVLDRDPLIYSNGRFASKSRAAFSVAVQLNEETGSKMTDGKFYFGSSKTSLINAKAATIVLGVHALLDGEDLTAFLTAGNKYYVQFRPDSADESEGCNSGIYSFVAIA